MRPPTTQEMQECIDRQNATIQKLEARISNLRGLARTLIAKVDLTDPEIIELLFQQIDPA